MLGSNYCRLHVTLDERSGRIRAIGVTDNLVKGAAGQAIQSFNILFSTSGDDRPRTAAARSVTAAVAQPEGVEDHAELPRGFRAGAARAGIKASGNPDLAVIVVDGLEPGSVAATFTTNRVAAAPVQVSRRHLEVSSGSDSYGSARAFICTSGCANAATGDAGVKDQEALAQALAIAAGCEPEETLAMSTGLIGTRLPVDRIVPNLGELVPSGLSNAPHGLR